VFRYYSGDCPDWRWSYEHHYPPLLADLQYYCPTNGTTLIPVCRKAFTPAIQLAYVLPKTQFDLLPEPMRDFLLTNYGEHYSDNLEFQWAFCRYFWEAHINFMHISVDELDNWR
jgi:5'-3' exonuclease